MWRAAFLVWLAIAGLPAPCHAQSGPEQIEQAEPERGEWQVQYSGSYGGADRHGLELARGVGRHWALGLDAEMEAEGGRLMLGELSAVALLRLSDDAEGPARFALMGALSIDRTARFAGGEVRGIAESRSHAWWLQANLMLRHRRGEGEAVTDIAYVLSVQRGPAPFWYGIEASGRPVRLAGDREGGTQYIGPSVTYRAERGGVELGLAWMARIAGRDAPSGPKLFAQFDF